MTAADATREQPLAARVDGAPATGRGSYRVRAIWRTLQGEGAFAGRPAVFVRFAGCNMWSGEDADRARDHARIGAACALFCDTDFRKAGSVRLSAAALVAEVLRVADAARLDAAQVDAAEAGRADAGRMDEAVVAGPRFVVLTGGEPLLQADAALVRALRAAGCFVAVETNGTVALADAFGAASDWPDWIACSPKRPDAATVLEACDELKLVVPAYRPADYPALSARVRPQRLGGADAYYRWLQPEDGPRLREAQRLAVALADADAAWRVSVQTHKVLAVD